MPRNVVLIQDEREPDVKNLLESLQDKAFRKAFDLGLMMRRRLSHGQTGRRVWLDVGAHLGEWTFAAAARDQGLTVYAFEPNLSIAAQTMGLLANFVVLPLAISEKDGSAEFHLNAYDQSSSLLPILPDGLKSWKGGERLSELSTVQVPTIRLDTFLNAVGVREVDFLKVDTQGSDLSALRSAGERIGSIRRVTAEVQITTVPLYQGSGSRSDLLTFMKNSGFTLISSQLQALGQEENLTFERR